MRNNVIDLAMIDAKMAKAINERIFGKGIALAAGFDLGAALPLDSRIIAQDIAERDAHVTGNRAYEGMQVYVVSEKKNYQLVDGQWIETGVTAEQLAGIQAAIDAAKAEVVKLVEAEKERAEGIEAQLRTDVDSVTGKVTVLEGQVTSGLATKVNVADVINTLDVEEEGKVLDARQGKALKDLISAEQSRAEGVETGLAGRLSVIEGDAEGSIKKALADAKTHADSKVAEENTARVEADKLQNEAIATKAEKSYVNAELEKKANVADLGTVAALNTGVAEGNVPVLGVNGKLDTAVLPKIAVNETFAVESFEEAMTKQVEVGDIVVINPNSAEVMAIVNKYKADSVNAAKGFKSLQSNAISDEFAGYLAEGKMTYICVDVNGETFADKFRPLQSAADTVSKAEFDRELALKADKSQVTTDIATAKSEAIAEAKKASEAVKSELDAYKTSNDAVVTEHGNKISALETEMPKKADKTQVTADIAAAKSELTTSIEAVDGKVTTLTEKVDNHIDDAVKHITAEERQAWNVKTDKFVAQIGDGQKTEFVLAHGLNSQDVTVAVREVATNELVFVNISCPDAENVKISFAKAPAENEFKVVVIG